MKTLTDEQYLKAAEYQQMIYEIDELLRHVVCDSHLEKFCEKQEDCDSCPMWISYGEIENCPLRNIGLDELSKIQLELTRKTIVQLLDEIDPDFELDEKRLEVTKRVDAVRRFRERYLGATHDHQ
jgi:hypothetical protein